MDNLSKKTGKSISSNARARVKAVSTVESLGASHENARSRPSPRAKEKVKETIGFAITAGRRDTYPEIVPTLLKAKEKESRKARISAAKHRGHLLGHSSPMASSHCVPSLKSPRSKGTWRGSEGPRRQSGRKPEYLVHR